MNIFFLFWCPKQAAQALCDKHIVRMPMESAQMLSTAVWQLKPDHNVQGVYKPAYKNHPMTVWVRSSRRNFEWALENGLELCNEYTRRYKRHHASQKVMELVRNFAANLEFPLEEFKEPPKCMPEQYHDEGDVVESYRRYYINDKAAFAKWRFSKTPEWWPQSLAQQENILLPPVVNKKKRAAKQLQVQEQVETQELRRSKRIRINNV